MFDLFGRRVLSQLGIVFEFYSIFEDFAKVCDNGGMGMESNMKKLPMNEEN